MRYIACIRLQAIIGLSLLLTSCTVGPDYKDQAIAVDVDYINSGTTLSIDQRELDWWALLKDKQLQELIQYSFKRNTNVLVAKAQLKEALALRTIARSAFFPALQANADYTAYELSLAGPGAASAFANAGAIQRSDDFYTGSLDASWELDFFGGTRRKSQAANRSLEAYQADYEATQLTLIAEVASAYFEYIGVEKHVKQHHRQLELQQQLQQLLENNYELGLANEVQVQQGKAQLALLQSQLKSLEASRNASLYRLGLVSTKIPTEISKGLTADTNIELPPMIAIGRPADLLQRRPDIIASERRLAAASANIGVAKAEYFPKLVINASYGFEAADASDIGSGLSRTTGLVPAIKWPIFAGKQLNANYKRALAQAEIAESVYDGILLNAIVDAETRLSNYAQSLQAMDNIKIAVVASTKATEKAYQLNQSGLTALQSAIEAEQQQILMQRQYIDIETQALVNVVQLYKSLGGSW